MITLYEHPEFVAKRPAWETWRDLYEGDHKTLTQPKYLWLHQIEKTTEGSKNLRPARQERTRYLNLAEILVSFWCGYYFQKPPAFDDATTSLLGDAMADITGTGKSFIAYLRDCVLPQILIYGKAITLVSKSSFEARNQAQYKALGIRPCLESIAPLSFPDWEVEQTTSGRIGLLNLARHEFDLWQPRASLEAQPTKKRMCHAYARNGSSVEVTVYSADIDQSKKIAAPVAAGDASISSYDWVREGSPRALAQSEIPIIITEDESWIKDAAEEILRFHNLRSCKDNVEYYQGYQKIFVTGVDFGNEAQRAALSEYVMSGLPEGATVIFGPAADTSSLESSCQQSLDAVFKVGLNQLRLLPGDSRVAQSDESISAEKSNSLALIESTVDMLEAHANRALQHWAAFEGIQNFDGKVTFNRDISQQSTQEFVAIAQAFADGFRRVEVVDKMVLKKAVERLKLSEDESAIAFEAIEAAQLGRQQLTEPTSPLEEFFNGRQETSSAPESPEE